ncbi:permease [bacterium]|nr:permease [bacterium]
MLEPEPDQQSPPAPASSATAVASTRFRPTRKMWIYFVLVLVMYASGLGYAWSHGLSISSLYLYGLLQPKGLSGEEARLAEIATPLSWNIPQVLWFVYLKSAAVLVELFQYWAVGMLIAGALIVFVSWEKIKARMGSGGFKANFLASCAGAVIPICSCGIVPVLAGMVQAGIPLGPTMAFLIAAPMLNIPTVFMTAGVLGWPMAVGRILATFGIALVVGEVLARWQRRHRNPRKFLKIVVTPRLSPQQQQFAFRFGLLATRKPEGLRAEELGPSADASLALLD